MRSRNRGEWGACCYIWTEEEWKKKEQESTEKGETLGLGWRGAGLGQDDRIQVQKYEATTGKMSCTNLTD